MTTVELPSLSATAALGARLARLLADGDVIGLRGDLGAGKTTLVQTIARGLGVPDAVPVTSPTFTLHQIYPGGRLVVHHLDLYRVETEGDLLSLGLDDLLGREGVALVEWFDRLGPRAPSDVLRLRLDLTGEESRRAQICADGPRSKAILRALASYRR